MAIEIVSFPIRHGDFPVRYVSHNQRVAESSGLAEAFQRTLASSQLSGIQVRRCADPSHGDLSRPENGQKTAMWLPSNVEMAWKS